MNSIKFLSVSYLIINLYGYIHGYSRINYIEEEADIKYYQLCNSLENTINPPKELLNNCLKFAFEKRYEDTIRYILINTRFSPKYQDKFGNTWLHYAAVLGDPEFLKILLKKNIDRNKRNILGDTPLHSHVRYNPNLKIIKMLFMTGVNPDLENNDGETALDIYLNKDATPDKKIITMLKKHRINYFLP